MNSWANAQNVNKRREISAMNVSKKNKPSTNIKSKIMSDTIIKRFAITNITIDSIPLVRENTISCELCLLITRIGEFNSLRTLSLVISAPISLKYRITYLVKNAEKSVLKINRLKIRHTSIK